MMPMIPGEDHFTYLCRTLVGRGVRITTLVASEFQVNVHGTLVEVSSSVITVMASRIDGSQGPVHIRPAAIVSIEPIG